MRTLFVSDLDGTLLDAEGRLSNRTRTVLRRMEEEGELITYATARSIHSARIVTEGWMPALPVIVYNGTMLVENETGEPAVFNTFSDDEREWLYRTFRKEKVSPLVYAFVEGQERVSWLASETNAGKAAYLAKRQGDRRLRRCVSEEMLYAGEPFYYTCIGERTELLPLWERLQAWGRSQSTFQRELYGQGEWWLEVMPYHATKAHAALQLKERLQCDRMVVFGDGINDLPLFQAADAGYAPANAAEEIKKQAAGILERNDEDGVARWLEAYLEEKMRLRENM